MNINKMLGSHDYVLIFFIDITLRSFGMHFNDEDDNPLFFVKLPIKFFFVNF